MAEHVKKSSAVLIVAAWIVVIVPAVWGLTFTVQNASKIFLHPTATALPAAPASAAK